MVQMDIRQVIPKKRHLKEKNILLRKTESENKFLKHVNPSLVDPSRDEINV
jgi:hypothetical protein